MKMEIRTEKVRKLRRQNIIPCVIYGKGIESISVQAEEKDLLKAYKENGQSSTFKVKIGKETHVVYMKNIERDTVNSKKFLHVGLHKVSKSDTMTVEVPINIIGSENLERQGFLVQTIMPKVEVEFGVGLGFNNINIDVTDLQVNDSVCVKDLKLPKGVVANAEPDALVVNITYGKIAKEETKEDSEVQTEEETV